MHRALMLDRLRPYSNSKDKLLDTMSIPHAGYARSAFSDLTSGLGTRQIKSHRLSYQATDRVEYVEQLKQQLGG